MYSLMISIISIALISAMALSSIYYGGASLNEGTTDADVAAIIHQGQQIQGAITMANIDRNATAQAISGATGSLVSEEYLQEAPTFDNNDWLESGASAVATGSAFLADLTGVPGYSLIPVGASVCEALNVKAGVTGTVTAITGLFGCVTASGAAFYKVGSYY